MQVNFELDWDYMLEKSCNFYERKPYKSVNVGYTYVDYIDPSIQSFLGVDPEEVILKKKDGKTLTLGTTHQMGLGNLVASRIEWRWEYSGARYYPVGARTCIEWELRSKKVNIINLDLGKPIRTVQPEQIFFCAYGINSYDKVMKFWEKTWLQPRNKND